MRRLAVSALSGALALTIALPALAAVDLSCMQTAIEKRENALIVAWGTFTSSINNAYGVRRDALKSAWGLTDAVSRKSAIKAAWTAFRDATKNSRKTLRGARKSAWKVFKVERKNCGAMGGNEEMGGESMDHGV